MVKTIILVNGVLVICYDIHGSQCISYQGQFNKVIDKIKKDIDISQIEWIIEENDIRRTASFYEWLSRGEKSSAQPMKHKRIDDSLIHQQTLSI